MKECLYSKQRFSIKTTIEVGKLWPRVRSGSQSDFIEVYWNSAFPRHLGVPSCYIELSSCDRNHMTGKVENIYYSAFEKIQKIQKERESKYFQCYPSGYQRQITPDNWPQPYFSVVLLTRGSQLNLCGPVSPSKLEDKNTS